MKSSEASETRKYEIFDGTTKTKSESGVKKNDYPKIQDSEAKNLFEENHFVRSRPNLRCILCRKSARMTRIFAVILVENEIIDPAST